MNEVIDVASSLPALASQSLSIIISLTPYIREFIRRHLNPKQAVVLIEFDKLKRVGSCRLSACRVVLILCDLRITKSISMRFMQS